MKSIMLITIGALFCTACGRDQQAGPNVADDIAIAGRNSNFLVKLTTSMSAESSNPGDVITGIVINPRPLRGGTVEGTIERADRSFLNFKFHSVEFDGKTYPFDSDLTAVVSSKGIAGQDDLGQRIRLAGGGVIAYGTTTAINEGAEIHFVAWEE